MEALMPVIPSRPASKRAATKKSAVYSPGLATFPAAVGVLIIGRFDYVTGAYSLAIFYLVPVAFATWYAGRVSGWSIAILSAVAWLVSDLALSYPRAHPLMPYWNAAMPGLIYVVVVELLTALRHFQIELEDRVRQRTASLATANAELDSARMHLIEADKLESVGRLAAGIAHEVKNPLMTIMMVVDYLDVVVPATEPDGRSMIDSLREAVDRANRVISEMLEFARPAPLLLEPQEFEPVAERALGLVKHELARKHLGLARDFVAHAPRISLDRHKMEQVLINVLLNAIHATPVDGLITVRTRLVLPDFIIEIDDTGSGISAKDQTKLFEPFFTTKPVGQGTGLGLSVARQIIQLHGGTLRLANRPEGGARVTIQLPLRRKTKA